MTTDQPRTGDTITTAAKVHAITVEVLTVLTDAPAELKGTTGYFRPEKARWTINRGSRWARTEEERAHYWQRPGFWGVEVFGPKTRAPGGGTSGQFFPDDQVPQWLTDQRPAALVEGEQFLAGADR